MRQGGVTIELDFPPTYREFVERFPNNTACATYLEQLRWPTGFFCPACGVLGTPWRQTRGRLVCPTCRHQASVTAGTIFEKTRTPLTTWFEAAWHLTTAKNGLSAQTLERTLGTGYRTAWALLQRYRVAMVRSERERLSGTVEVDETLVGGVVHGGRRGRGTGKAVVVIAVEIKEPRGFGRLRMRHVPDASGAPSPGLCGGRHRPGSDGVHGRLDGVQRPARVRARTHRAFLVGRSRSRLDARRASRRRPSQTLDPGHTSGLRHSGAPTVLPGGVHVPLQQTQFRQSGARLPPPDGAGRGYRTAHRGGADVRLRLEPESGEEELTDYPPFRDFFTGWLR